MSKEYTIKRYVGFVSLVLVFVFVLSTEARAELYGFGVVENNSLIAETIAAQLSLEVTDNGGTTVDIGGEDHYQALFTFSNLGPLSSSITDIYFEDGTLLLLANIDDTNPGVDFGQPVSPENLTGWSTLDPKFYATSSFTVDSESPVFANGVNPGESLGLLYTLQYGKDFDDVLAAISVGFNPDEYYNEVSESWDESHIRIGIRVQGTGEGEEFSDSLILTPEPGSLLLGSIGIGMVIARCRKRKTLIES